MTSSPSYPIALPEWPVFPGDEATYPITDLMADGVTPFDLTTIGPDWTVTIGRTLDSQLTDLDPTTTDIAIGKFGIDMSGAIAAALSPSRGFGIAVSDRNDPDYMVIVRVTGGPLDPVTPYAIPVRITSVGSNALAGGATVIRTGTGPGAVVVRVPGQPGDPGPPGADGAPGGVIDVNGQAGHVLLTSPVAMAMILGRR